MNEYYALKSSPIQENCVGSRQSQIDEHLNLLNNEVLDIITKISKLSTRLEPVLNVDYPICPDECGKDRAQLSPLGERLTSIRESVIRANFYIDNLTNRLAI